MTAGDWVTLVGVIIAACGGGVGFLALLTLRDQKDRLKGETKAKLAEGRDLHASADGRWAVIYEGIVNQIQEELTRTIDRVQALEQQLAETQRELGFSTAREAVCEQNCLVLRDALLRAGAPVPKLRSIYDIRTGEHPLRRATDYPPLSEGDPEP